MTLARILIIFLFLVLADPPARAQTVVIDIDWTLIYHITADEAARDPHNVVRAGEAYYRFADYAVESIELLHRAGIEVTFFSGGKAERNQAVIEDLYRRVNEISEAPRAVAPYFSMEHLTVLAPESSGLSFWERFKKNLLTILPGRHLHEIVIFDDDPRSATHGQKENYLSFRAFRDFTDYRTSRISDAPAGYVPQSEFQWWIERHKFVIATEAILRASNPKMRGSFLTRLRASMGAVPDQPMTMEKARVNELARLGLRRIDRAGLTLLPRSRARLRSCKNLVI